MFLANTSKVSEITPPRQFRVTTGRLRLKTLEPGETVEHQEHATFTIDDKTGQFSATTEYGDFSYQWTSIGSDTLADFLCSLDMHYFMDKAAKQPWHELDNDIVFTALRKDVLEARYGRRLDKCEARTLWESVDSIEGERPLTVDSFYHYLSAEAELYAFSPPYDFTPPLRVKATALHFWNVIWKAFTDHLKTLSDAEVKRTDLTGETSCNSQ